MSRFRQALAATTMAVAAASGGLLLAAAVAAPASASAPAAPPHRAHTITIAARPKAATGIRPGDTEFPCAVKRGVAPSASGCLPPAIECHLTVTPLTIDTNARTVTSTAFASCNADVPRIALTQNLLFGSVIVDSMPVSPAGNAASTQVTSGCVSGSWSSTGSALITFPAGYVLTGGSNPMTASVTRQIAVPDCFPSSGGGGGGGGGGCIVPAPSTSAHPAGRQPHVITCH